MKAQNKGNRTTAISRDSQVRAYVVGAYRWAGTWRKLGLSVWLSPGQTRSWTYNMNMGCKTSRQYRFLVKEFDSNKNLLNEVWAYHPSNRTSYTREQSFDIGDLDRHF